MISRRYKVVEKQGGLGEVLQITVRDVGVNTGENTPPLHITPLRECPVASSISCWREANGNTGMCAACVRWKRRVHQLEERLLDLERQLNMSELLNALKSRLDAQLASGSANPTGSGLKETTMSRFPFICKGKTLQNDLNKDEEAPRSVEKIVDKELRRQSLLHALMNLLEQPTFAEKKFFVGKSIPKCVKALLGSH